MDIEHITQLSADWAHIAPDAAKNVPTPKVDCTYICVHVYTLVHYKSVHYRLFLKVLLRERVSSFLTAHQHKSNASASNQSLPKVQNISK